MLKDLIARLRLDTAPFKAGVNDAKGATTGLATVMRGALLPVAAALAAAFSARAIFAGITQGAAEIDAVAKSAQALGGSIGGFRAFELAAGDAGVNAANLRADVQNLDRALASGRADVAMRALGLSASELGRMDVDARLGTIADAIADMGLSAGQTGALLQSMGVENRDMTLLMMQGGDALRAARADVESYGLAVSAVDASAIERANDQFGRLSVIGQYLRQELAEGVMPELGRLAELFTNSMREGGALRAVIDALTGALAWLVDIVSSFVSIVAAFVSWVGDGVVAVYEMTGGFFGLGAAVQGILGVLDAVLGWAYDYITFTADLIRGAGGFGEALSLLGVVAGEVWEGIKISAQALVPGLESVWEGITADFLLMLSSLTENWSRFLSGLAANLPEIPGFETGLGARLQDAANAALARSSQFDGQAAGAGRRSASAGAEAAGYVSEGLARGTAALQRLRDVAASATTEATGAAGAVRGIADAAATLGGDTGGGGGAANRAADGVKKLTEAAKEAQRVGQAMANTWENAFVGVITRTASLKDALAQVAMEFAKMAAQSAFKSLTAGLFTGTGFLGKLFGGKFADGGVFSGGRVVPFAQGGVVSSATAFPLAGGMTGLMGEAGPEAIMPLARGVDGRLGVRAGGGAQALRVTVTMDATTGALGAFVQDMAGQVVARAAPAIAGAAVQQVVAMHREERTFR